MALLGIAAALLLAFNSGAVRADADSDTGTAVATIGVGGTTLGVYDPDGSFGPATNITIEHIYLPLVGVDLDSLRMAGDYAAARGRDLLVTVEPWSWNSSWDPSNESLAAAIRNGETTDDIIALCKTIGRLPRQVTLRWGHEMEAKTNRYAWTLLEPVDYIAGYRQFVTLCRQYAPAAKFMWSPLGLPDLIRYYPGDDVVDVVGVTVFALQAYEQDHHGWDRNVTEIAKERLALVARFGRPMMIAELGCSGDQTYREECREEILALDVEIPRLAGAVYFNDVEPVAWPEGYGRPDWRLPPAPSAR